MATNGKASYHGSTNHPTRVLRNASSVFMGQPTGTHANAASATTRGGSYGVVGDGDLLVTTTGSLGYSVAPGRVGGPGTFAAYQGWYGGYNDAAVTGSFSARHATLTRVDYVAWRVRDTDEDATTFEDDGIVIIAGTAGSGAPSVPSSLGTLVILAEVTIPSSAAGTALTFVDRRTKLSAVGAQVRCTSTTRPTGIALYDGLQIFETDTKLRYHYNSTAAAWCRDTPRVLVNGSEQNGTGGGTLTVQYESRVVSTDGSGFFVITYGTAFAATPTLVAIGGDDAAGPLVININTVAFNAFNGYARNAVGGALVASTSIRVNYTAVGFTA